VKLKRLALAGVAVLGLTAAAAPPAASASAYPPGLRPAAGVPNALGPGWTPAYWTAESGGGCAVPAENASLAVIVSDTCGSWTWYWRDLGAYPEHGQMIELVSPSGTEAAGFSAGQFRLETPNSGSTFVVFDTDLPLGVGCSGNWCTVQDNAVSDFALPAGKGQPLRVSGSASAPPDGWQH
jgi:hypothetical protein